MTIIQSLSTLSLRPLLNHEAPEAGSAAGHVGRRLLAEQGPRLAEALARAHDRTWKTVEIALAGAGWWKRCRVLLEAGEEVTLNEPIEAFLAGVPFPELSEETRLRYVRDLRAARQAGLLSGTPAVSAAPPEGHGDGSLIEQAAAGLKDAGHSALADFLARCSPEAPLPTGALRFYLRREIEAVPELAAGVDAPTLTALSGDAGNRFAPLAYMLDRQGARLEVLLATFETADAEPDGFPLDIDRETEDQSDDIRQLAAEVRQMLAQHQMLNRELRLADSGSIRQPALRERIMQLKSQFLTLPAELQPRLPALRYGLAMLETAAGDFDTAQHDFQAIAAATSRPRLLALVFFNQYQVALEQHDWAEALILLERAATLRPEQFAPFPMTKYEPERILGVGASGVAFLCRNRPSDTHVVVKAFWPGGIATDVSDVFREARVLEEMDHPSIIKLRDCDFADAGKTRPYLVTDYFEGLTLAEQVEQRGPLAAEDVLHIARAVAQAMVTAHQRNILHRDLKPDHILLRKEETGWRVKLIDFSIAVQPLVLHGSLTRNDLGARTMVGASAAGTIPYAAPEVVGWVQGVPSGPYSDVYSYGKMCYFGLLGTPEPDDEEKETLPPAWRKLLASCTARTTARRLPNFQLVLERLNQVQAAAPAKAPAGPAGADPERVAKLLERGNQFRQQGDYEHALLAFSKVLQLDANHTAAYIKRGNVYLDRGELDRAIADYSAAIKVDPRLALAYLNRGLAHAKKGEFDQVLADANAAIQIDPKLSAAHFLRGAAYANRGDKHRAIAEFTLAIKLDPKNPLTYNDRGMAYVDQGEYDRAVADYTAALRLDPRLTLAYVNRGIAFRLKGNIDRAIAEFTKALRVEPRSVPAYYNRGLAHMEKKDFDRAAIDFERAARLDPRHPEAIARRDEAKRLRGASGVLVRGRPPQPPQIGKSEPASSTRLPRVGPQPPPAGKGDSPSSTRLPKIDPQALAKARKEEPASSTRLPKVQVPPSNEPPKAEPPKLTPEEERRQMQAAAFFTRGRAFYEQKEYGPAVDQFTKAIQLDPKDPQSFYQRGLSYVAQNKCQEAVSDYTTALHLNPRYVQALYHRAIARQLLGSLDEAIADYTSALQINPRLAMAYRHRGQAYAAKGDQERAKADLEEAMRIDPNLGKK